eukprot:11220165-Lingulodinium_polyedra.AAC.1
MGVRVQFLQRALGNIVAVFPVGLTSGRGFRDPAYDGWQAYSSQVVENECLGASPSRVGVQRACVAAR